MYPPTRSCRFVSQRDGEALLLLHVFRANLQLFLLPLPFARVLYKDGQMDGPPATCAAVKGTKITVSA